MQMQGSDEAAPMSQNPCNPLRVRLALAAPALVLSALVLLSGLQSGCARGQGPRPLPEAAGSR
jgi:hypothetical protein